MRGNKLRTSYAVSHEWSCDEENFALNSPHDSKTPYDLKLKV